MKTNRIFTIITVLSLSLPISGYGQSFLKDLGKAVGNAVVNTALEGISGEKSDKDSQGEEIPASSRPAPVEGTKVVTNHPDLKIKIKRCEVSGKTCVIDLIVTNYGNDTEIRFYSKGVSNVTKAFDDEGNQYRIAIGISGYTPDYYSASSVFPTEVPLKCRLQIEGIPASATMIKRIYLHLDCEQMSLNGDKPVLFYNIPISREGDE